MNLKSLLAASLTFAALAMPVNAVLAQDASSSSAPADASSSSAAPAPADAAAAATPDQNWLKICDPAKDGKGFGLSEYRVSGSYRAVHAWRSNTDLVVTTTVERAIRTSFTYVRRGASAAWARPSERVDVTRTSGRHYRATRDRVRAPAGPRAARALPVRIDS